MSDYERGVLSVYEEMEDLIDNARLNDECTYDVYSQMVDLIREAGEQDSKLKELSNRFSQIYWQLIEIRKLVDKLGIEVSHADDDS